jgi:hypothetical protein
VNCTVVADLGPLAGAHSGSSLKIDDSQRWVLAVQRRVSRVTRAKAAWDHVSIDFAKRRDSDGITDRLDNTKI